MTSTAAVIGALVALVLFHGSAAGARAAAGRDGRLDHWRAERIGAFRAMAVALALVAPVVVVGVLEAGADPSRLDVYERASLAFLMTAGPFAAVGALTVAIALVAPWPVRAIANTVVIGALEFLRPAIAIAGVLAAWWATRDVTVTGLGALAAASALQTYRVTARLWYAAPATLPALTESSVVQGARRGHLLSTSTRSGGDLVREREAS